jgi:hypothetical protein
VANRRVIAPRIDFGALRRELDLPTQFPADAQREADESAAKVSLPATDRTDLPFVTIDPASSRDLDQAVCLSRRAGGGYRVYYAIADVASFVAPGGALEAETWRRGQTVYLPDGKVPLHPVSLSEGAASLLSDAERPAVVWTIDLDAEGETVAVALERARVRSRAKLDYAGVQAKADTDELPEAIALLPEIGKLLIARGLERGAINLPLPEQEIEPVPSHEACRNGTSQRLPAEDGTPGWKLVLRAPLAVEEYNAQISLLTGQAAPTRRGRPPARGRDRTRHRMARRSVGGFGPGECQPGRAAGGGLRRPRRRVDARCRLHRLRRRAPLGTGARCGGRAVRTRHRAAAAPGRPVCHRGMPRALRRAAGA